MFKVNYTAVFLTVFAILSSSAMATDKNIKKIPFKLEDSFIFVSAKLPSKLESREFQLLFDLGDYRSISLTKEVLNQIEHQKLNQFDTFQDYKGDTFKAQRFELPKFEVGGTSFETAIGSEDIQDPQNLSPSPYGAIGAGLFEDQTLTINFQKHRLELSKTPLEQCQSFDPQSGAIVAPLQLDGQKKLFIIDTGTTHSVIDHKSAQQELASRELVIIKSLKSQNLNLENFPLQMIELNIPGIDGILGQDVLKQSSLSIDFKNACFRFTS